MTAVHTFTDPTTGAQLIQYADGSWVFIGEIQAGDFGVFRVESLLPTPAPAPFDAVAECKALAAAAAEGLRS